MKYPHNFASIISIPTAVLLGCSAPEPAGQDSSGNATSGQADTDNAIPDTAAEPTMSSQGPVEDSSSSTPGSDGTDSETGNVANCGDGVLGGEELCDDGINDGEYGHCLADCSGLAEHCGDGEVQAEHGESCDDALLADGELGCSSECQATGQLLDSIDLELPSCGALGTIVPQFDTDGLGLVGARGGSCVSLFELDARLQVVRSFDEDDFPPYARTRSASAAADAWLIDVSCIAKVDTSAECISHPGSTLSMEGHSNGSYYVLTSEYPANPSLSFFGAGTPNLDPPTWVVEATPGQWVVDTAFEADGSIVRGGQINNLGGAFVTRITESGTRTDVATFPDTGSFDQVGPASDGGLFVVGLQNSEFVISRLNAGLEREWSVEVTAMFGFGTELLVDAFDQPMLVQTEDPEVTITKWSRDGQDILWTRALPEEPASQPVRLEVAAAPNGTTWTSRRLVDQEGGERLRIERFGI